MVLNHFSGSSKRQGERLLAANWPPKTGALRAERHRCCIQHHATSARFEAVKPKRLNFWTRTLTSLHTRTQKHRGARTFAPNLWPMALLGSCQGIILRCKLFWLPFSFLHLHRLNWGDRPRGSCSSYSFSSSPASDQLWHPNSIRIRIPSAIYIGQCRKTNNRHQPFYEPATVVEITSKRWSKKINLKRN